MIILVDLEKIIEWNNEYLVCREYSFEKDPPKLVKYCYDKMNSEKGIATLTEADKLFLNCPNKRIRLVAEFRNEIISSLTLLGCLGPKPNDNFTIYSMVTGEKFRRQGVGKVLVNFAIEWVKKFDTRFLLVETWQDNSAAIDFYKSMDFKCYGCLPKGLVSGNGTGFVDAMYFYRNLGEKCKHNRLEIN
jgi:GNAT superfamily N-acetyltransferase